MKKAILSALCVLLSQTVMAADVMGPPAPSALDTGSVTLTKDNTLSINDVFWGDVVSKIIKEAKSLDSRVDSGDPIYLVINSPGGSIEDGLELIENLSHLKRPIHTVTLFGASMGFQTVQGLGDRLIIRNGTLMSHKARGFFYGEFPGQLDSRYGHYMKRVMRMDEVAVKRTKGKHTLKSYHDLIENEYWCDGQDCIDQGFADKIVGASCDKSLEGTKDMPLWQEIMFGHTVELWATYDLCPLNTNILKTKILLDGQPLFLDALPQQQSPLVKQATQKQDMYSSLFGSYYNSYDYSRYNESVAVKLTKDELFEINKKVKEAIDKKEKREVIKGY